MIHITEPQDTVNLEKLDSDLRAALGDTCAGVSFGKGTVTVHLTPEASASQQKTACTIVQRHDPADLTPGQVTSAARDALPLFKLSAAEAETWAESQDPAAFRRAVAQAFVHLRDVLRG